MSKKIVKIAYVMVCALIMLVKECHAYLDPSAMTYMIQIVSAIGITLATSMGIFFYKIRKFLKRKKEKMNKEILTEK